jgi:hypothetical protein
MTPTQEREAFEKWYIRNYRPHIYSLHLHGDVYHNLTAERCWQVWQARAALNADAAADTSHTPSETGSPEPKAQKDTA